jgi:hypothetical protein
LIEQLKALDAKDKAQYHDFALKCLKDYIKNNPSWRKDDESIINPQELLGFDPKLEHMSHSYTTYHIDAFLEYLHTQNISDY